MGKFEIVYKKRLLCIGYAGRQKRKSFSAPEPLPIVCKQTISFSRSGHIRCQNTAPKCRRKMMFLCRDSLSLLASGIDNTSLFFVHYFKHHSRIHTCSPNSPCGFIKLILVFNFKSISPLCS